MHDGSHPPGAIFVVGCIGKTGLTVSFSSDQAIIDATFPEQEDADYFEVGKSYAVDFRVADPGKPGGGGKP